jgi:hypothetical protein
MMKTNKLLAGLGLLATAFPSVVLAQVINRPSNERPPEGGGNTVYIVVAVVVVAVAAFLFFRGKKKD